MATVWVIQNNGGRSFAKAERFGTLVPVLERDAFPDDADERAAAMQRILRAKLINFAASWDFILLTGDPLALMLTGLVMRDYVRSGWQALKWDRENHDYYVVNIKS